MASRWTTIALLVACSALVQRTIVHRAAIPALDSLRSVAAAEALIQSPSFATLREEPESPLFPAWLALVHTARGAIGAWPGAGRPDWATSVQLAAALPLAVWPAVMYGLARRRFGPRSGVIAGLLACVLPAAARLGGEGLQDALHLLLFTIAMALLTSSQPSTVRSIGAGGVLALAMLVRVEAVLILPIVAIFHGRSTRMALPALGMALVLVPWLWSVDSLSPPDAIARLAARSPARDGWVFNLPILSASSISPEHVSDEVHSFDSKERGTSTRRYGWRAALNQTGDELLVATGFALPPLALVTALRPRRLRRWDRLALAGTVVWAGLGFANALLTGYLSSRHVLPVAVFMLPAAAKTLAGHSTGIIAVGLLRRVGAWGRGAQQSACDARIAGASLESPRKSNDAPDGSHWSLDLRAPAPGTLVATSTRNSRHDSLSVLPSKARDVALRAVGIAVLLAWAAWCWQPLHGDRAGHGEAGGWLALQADSTDRVLDTWGWSALTSGRPTYRYDAARAAFADPQLRFVVVEQRELDSGTPRAATLRALLGRQASCAAEFSPPGAQSAVLIFHWRPLLAQNEPRQTGWLGSNALIRPERAGPGGE